MKILESNKKNFLIELKKYLSNRNENTNTKVDKFVKNILDEVKQKGDEALIKYTKEFDRIELKSQTTTVLSCQLQTPRAAYASKSLTKTQATSTGTEPPNTGTCVTG